MRRSVTQWVLAWSPIGLACTPAPTEVVPTDGTGTTASAETTTTADPTLGDGSTARPPDPDSTGTSPTGSGPDGSSGSTGTSDPSDSSTTSGAPACIGQPVLHFVYFVEADQVFSEQQRGDIEAFAFAFQQYWYEQLGATFYLAQPVVDVIMAAHESTWYVETPDGIHVDPRWYRLGNIKTEVQAALGIGDFDPLHRVVSYPIARFDGLVGVNFGGAWMDGDDLTCMPDDGPTFPFDKGGPAHCMGHVAHEVGHVLGLGHTGPEEDCMQLGFYDSVGGTGMCDFSADNVAAILSHPDNAGWLDAEPGDTCVPAR